MGNFNQGGGFRGGNGGGGFRSEGGGFRGGQGGGGGFKKDFGGPREMHEATCSECGTACKVPFKPMEGKPVFCRECYSKKKGF
ncbi:DNA-directed RNA polymerase [Candidatus Woesearchaeota archaeon]|nr:DNA-directed RNA polymerase [Candidatus Woesearchaeota archaeon]